MADGKKKNGKHTAKYILIIAAAGFFLFSALFRFSVFSETPAPEPVQTTSAADNTPAEETPAEETLPAEQTPGQEPTSPAEPTPPATPTDVPTEPPATPTDVPTEPPATPTPVPVTESPTPAPTPSPTQQITAEPTPTPELQYLYDFTVPPLTQGGASDKTLSPGNTPAPTMLAASVGIVQVENIDNTERGFQWFDLIKGLEYAFYIMAGVAVVYGIVCLIGLLCFKKDLSIAALRKKKKDSRKAGKR